MRFFEQITRLQESSGSLFEEMRTRPCHLTLTGLQGGDIRGTPKGKYVMISGSGKGYLCVVAAAIMWAISGRPASPFRGRIYPMEVVQLRATWPPPPGDRILGEA